MAKQAKKEIEAEAHPCPHCRKINRMVVLESHEKLNPTYNKKLKKLGIIIVRKGENFSCPYCQKTISIN
ncbi:MAG TPA: hypothetical protein ENN28_01980 [Candidatus Uhrbacteria bacterium]|nr:hypothetical protein [Candidatus Uhrbacteria bacterium]